jgi:hypothetical protein
MSDKTKPCNQDHNGECLVCDCWLSNCALDRLRIGDFKYETLDELLDVFKDHLTEKEVRKLRTEFDKK